MQPVLHVASGREWRGGERQVWLLARALTHLGVPQHLVTANGSALARRARAAGVTVTEVPWELGLDPRALFILIRRMRALDAIVHAHDAHALRLALLARPRGRSLVATRRVTFPVRRGGTWSRADRVIAISEAVALALREGGVPTTRITVIPSGIALDDFAAVRPADTRARLGFEVATPLLVNVAALTHEKGHDTLLRAAAVLRAARPDARWVVAGAGPARARLAALAASLGLSDVVTFLGHVEDVAGLLADATVVVSASEAEGLGSTLLDAMALARPIVATSVGGVPEVLARGAGLLVPAGDAARLASGIERVLGDAAGARALGMRAREVVADFGIDRMAERTLAVYGSLTSAAERK